MAGNVAGSRLGEKEREDADRPTHSTHVCACLLFRAILGWMRRSIHFHDYNFYVSKEFSKTRRKTFVDGEELQPRGRYA